MQTEVLEYRPSDDEPFMNPRQREYFRQKLERWRDDILRESRETLDNLQEESQNHPDMADRASSESDRALELRTQNLVFEHAPGPLRAGICERHRSAQSHLRAHSRPERAGME